LEALLARKLQGASSAAAPSKEAALRFLTEVSQATGKDEKVGDSLHRTTRETQGAVLYEYSESDASAPGQTRVLHRSYVRR
jgi:hypothetical protein